MHSAQSTPWGILGHWDIGTWDLGETHGTGDIGTIARDRLHNCTLQEWAELNKLTPPRCLSLCTLPIILLSTSLNYSFNASERVDKSSFCSFVRSTLGRNLGLPKSEPREEWVAEEHFVMLFFHKIVPSLPMQLLRYRKVDLVAFDYVLVLSRSSDESSVDHVVDQRKRWTEKVNNVCESTASQAVSAENSLKELNTLLERSIEQMRTNRQVRSQPPIPEHASQKVGQGSRLSGRAREIAEKDSAAEEEILHCRKSAEEALELLRNDIKRFTAAWHQSQTYFTISVFGRTGVGKSTFITALSGEQSSSISSGRSGFTTE